MKNMKLINTEICFMLIMIIASCKKDEKMSEVPEITYQSANVSTVQQFNGELIFTIAYKDGDGDLGENKDGVHNLFLKDNRNGLVYPYRVKQLGPGTVAAIQGTLQVTLNTVALTDSVNSQQVSYSIYMVDRAGHSSNTVTTSAITITK